MYASNNSAERRRLWESVVHIAGRVGGPWLIQVDFNAILSIQERIRRVEIDNSSEEVRDCIANVGLMELKTM